MGWYQRRVHGDSHSSAAQWKISGNMRPFVALTFVLGCAYAAPAELGLAGVHALGYAAAPAAVGVAAAPIAYGAEHYSAGPVVAHAPVAYAAPPAPAPYTTAHQGPGVTTVHQGTQTVNAPIVKTQTEIHNVQDPVFVERKV